MGTNRISRRGFLKRGAGLAAAGVARVYGNDGGAAWCTVGNAARFFSQHRDQRRQGGSGRMAACIWRV